MQLSPDEDDNMKLPGFHLGQHLTTYLAQIRKVITSKTPQNVTLVMGNPSCDLDSFISAFTLSYFYNGKPRSQHKAPIYVPILNLPYIENEDLWRLRPEFGVAIRGAFDGLTPQAKIDDQQKEADRKRDRVLLEQLITIHELANSKDVLPSLRRAFEPSERYSSNDKDGAQESQEKLDVILVDHNAPAIETITDKDIKSRFNVVGCVDHHVEENYTPTGAKPRIIRFGIGSCCTLVTDHLRRLNLWTADTESKRQPGCQQIARLALTPILVDTWDLKAGGDKCSDLDREQVAWLDHLTGDDFDREDLFNQAQTAKIESLNLLRMQEIFARDYKSYAERMGDGDYLNIGIASVVEDLKWLSHHAKDKQNLVNEMVKYCRHGQKLLEVFGLLTRNGDQKQVCIFSFGDHGKEAIPLFEESAGALKLEKWDEDDQLSQILNGTLGKGYWKIWWMGDTSKSRKQVAPLLRDAMKQT